MADEPRTAPAIGIDLGTTFCCVGVYINGQVRIIPNLESGDSITPSYVYFEPKGDAVIGNPAKSNAFRNPENTIFDVKRILGREFKNPELQSDMKFWPFTVQEGDKDVPMVNVNGELLYPEEISAKLLSKLRSFAETFLQLEEGTIKKAVITVPAYFHDGQRQATIDAGELAGLEVLTILNEPTAAAIAYSLQRFDTKPKKILVYDLGGGTFDVAVLNIEQNKIEVLGVNGDTHLGGEDFDRKMMEFCAARFEKETGIDLLEGKDSTDDTVSQNVRRNLRRLQTYCENAKSYLTNGHQTKMSVDVLTNGKDLVVDLKRSQFEEMNETYFRKTIDLVDSTLEELGLSKDEIDDVVLVGGSTRIPKVRQLLKEYFEGKSLNQAIHADQAVAYGAAIQAAVMTGEKSLGHIKFDKIQDVTPMPLGTGVFPDRFKMIIPKGTQFPVKMSTVVSTLHDNQTSANIQVFQGNDFVASNNRLLGEFTLDGIPPKKAGEETLDIWMEINEMGVLHVSAECRSTGQRNDVTITENKNRMSKEMKAKLLAKGKHNISVHGRLSRLLSS